MRRAARGSAVRLAPRGLPTDRPIPLPAPRGFANVPSRQSFVWDSLPHAEASKAPCVAMFAIAGLCIARSAGARYSLRRVAGLVGHRTSLLLAAGQSPVESVARREVDPDDRIRLVEVDVRPGFRLAPDPVKPKSSKKPVVSTPVDPFPSLDPFPASAAPSAAEEGMVEEDLNGISPVWVFVGSAMAAACSFASWRALQLLGTYYALHPIEEDWVYPAQRAMGFMHHFTVGAAALSSGVFGFSSLGMFLLALRITKGVLTGELDPSAPRRGAVPPVDDRSSD